MHLKRMLGLLFVLTPAAVVAQSPRIVARLQRELVGHTDVGRQIAFSPDGQLVATSSVDKTVKLWRVADGKLIRTITHPQGVTAIAFTPDGKFLVSGSYDAALRLWRVGDGSLTGTLKGHSGTIWSVAVSPDGKTVASSGEDKTVKLWRLADGALLRTLTGHQRNIWHVAFSPDGKTVGSSSFDNTLKLWSPDDGRLLRTLTGHSQAIVGFAFSPDGSTIATGSDDSSIKLWRAGDGQLLRTISGGNQIYSVVFSPDGQWLVGAGRARSAFGTFWHQIFGDRFIPDGESIRLWRVSDGAAQDTRPGDDIWDVDVSPDGRWLASSGEDRIMRLWRLETVAQPTSAGR